MSALSEGYDRLYEFVIAATEGPAREPLADWRDSIRDAAGEIAWIVERGAHPDDVSRARTAMSSLASIWLSADEVDALYLGTAEQ